MANEPNRPDHPYYKGENHFRSPRDAQTQYFIDPSKIPGYDTTGPEMVTSPTYTPPAPIRIGTSYSFTPGTYAATGGGVVDVVTRWLVGGAPKANPYTPSQSDDLLSMVLDEVATETGGTNDGVTSYTSRVGVITNTAPIADENLSDQSFYEKSGDQTSEAAQDFEGTGGGVVTDYSINSVPGVTIDSTTGQITYDTDNMVPQANTLIVVTGANSGGFAQTSFFLEIFEEATAPVIQNLTIDSITGDIAFETDMEEGTAYAIFSDDPNPSANDIITGNGDISTNWPITVSGGNSGVIDLTPIEGQTKYLSVVHVSDDPAASNILTQTVEVDALAPGYTMNRVVSAASWIRLTGGQIPHSPQVTYSAWITPADGNSGARLTDLRGSVGHRFEMGNNGRLTLSLMDSSDTTIFMANTTDVVLATGVETHVYYRADLSVPEVEILVDRVAVPLTVSVPLVPGTGLLRLLGDNLFLGGQNAVLAYNGAVADMWFSNESIPHTAFVDGAGNPKDLIGVGSPKAWWGGPMTADLGAPNNLGWNGKEHLGSIPVNTGQGAFNFIDLP